MESLADILKRVTSRERKDPPVELEPEDVCTICNGAGFLGKSLDFTRKRTDYVMQVYPCRCQSNVGGVQTFDNFNCPGSSPDLAIARQLIQRWARGVGKSIVVLAGERGVGKTHLSRAACGIISEAVLWTTDGDINDQIFNSFDHHTTSDLMKWYASCRWMIIDDFGATSKIPGVEARVDRIIDSRIEAVDKFGGRTLITTNLKPDQMSPRTSSRVQDVRRVESFTIEAPDYRQHPHGG